ncbi:hypothetical protein L198_04885 [Cryptococcus wingfieldii CBS 7118]|uniref:HAT C-terminal dimerisation domain-containing protein n=1 Tax=Cryptococcus wingfieldii CBS 7118 TaxID=1295528 RepID=A0A1E3J452_9TREE|nr:hypothetical protein L198_04885 [Cryptococcus wingfieldii CBS 7118]ODN94741.1 hypothetical protein L198_04885 [Cryptococcus wingfieldii CBS 7118]
MSYAQRGGQFGSDSKSIYQARAELAMNWWKHHHEYPVLARMARDFLAIPASSIPIEQLYSMAEKFDADIGAGISEETLENFVMVGDLDRQLDRGVDPGVRFTGKRQADGSWEKAGSKQRAR